MSLLILHHFAYFNIGFVFSNRVLLDTDLHRFTPWDNVFTYLTGWTPIPDFLIFCCSSSWLSDFLISALYDLSSKFCISFIFIIYSTNYNRKKRAHFKKMYVIRHPQVVFRISYIVCRQGILDIRILNSVSCILFFGLFFTFFVFFQFFYLHLARDIRFIFIDNGSSLSYLMGWSPLDVLLRNRKS